MGILNGIIGNASRMDPAAAAHEYGRLLGHSEALLSYYVAR
jgi:hypothetical protein